jgi:hypothetical protein
LVSFHEVSKPKFCINISFHSVCTVPSFQFHKLQQLVLMLMCWDCLCTAGHQRACFSSPDDIQYEELRRNDTARIKPKKS